MLRHRILYLLFPAVSFGLVPDLNSTLLELLHMKNAEPRYSLGLKKISSRFTPEDHTYYEGLIVQGWWALLLSVCSLLLFLVISFARFRYGYFGGKKLKNTEFSAYVRWAPGLILTVSFLLFFVSGASLLIESSKINQKTQKLSRITSEYSHSVNKDIESTYDYMISFNMQHALDGLYFDVNEIKLPLKEANFIEDRELHFKKDVKSLNSRRIVVSLVIFCLGFVVFGIGALGFVLKIESLGYILAIAMAVLTSLDFLTIIPYTMQRVASTDFCEQIIECSVENSLPVSGHELGYYFFDLSQTSKNQIKASQVKLNKLFKASKEKISQFQGNQINSFEDINLKSIDNDLEEIIWVNSFVIVAEAMKTTERLGNSFYIKRFCKEVMVEVCGEVFGSFLLAEFTVAVLAVSLGLACLSGFLAPRVFERWRLEEEQNALAKHNLYQIKQ